MSAKQRWEVDESTGCWNWLLLLDKDGYGQVTYFPRPRQRLTYRAHRWAYEQWVGPIPDSLHIDHLCRNKACVNPEHLEAVTQQENNRRKQQALGVGIYATHCKHGHEFTEANTYVSPGRRSCRSCNARHKRNAAARAKAGAA